MSFTFPEDKNDFRAPNGVVYRWDGFKWVVKSFRSQDDFLVTLDDDPPDEPKEGDLWFDTKADELTLYLYTGTEWVPASPPVSLDGIQAQINDALIIQDDLLGRVAAGEIKQRQIELALEELSVTKGSVARYTVTETHIGAAIRNGELYVSSPNAADVQAISFAPFDINGQPTRPANTGDIIEFVETTRAVGEVTRYRIVNGGDSQALTVEYISGNNDFAKGESEEVYIYPQNEEGVSKEYVDAQDALSLKLASSNDVTTSFRIKNDGKTLISTGTEGVLKLYHVVDPTENEHAANKKYVDDAITAIPDADLSLYLKKSGGTMTGSLQINRGEKPSPQWKITPNSGDNYATNIYSLGNGDMRFRTSHTASEEDHKGSHIVLIPNGGEPQTKIYNVVEAGETTAVPRSYVDNAVANAGGGTPPGPASLCWEWRNHDTLSDPGETKAAWYSASSFFRLNLKTANGVFLGKNVLSRKDVSFNQHLTGGIWRLVGGDWQMVQLYQIHRMQWNHNDCVWLYRNNIILGSNTFTAGEKYYFTVGGFF